MKRNVCTYKDALKDALPVVIGFIPIAIAFGILTKTVKLSLLQSLGFSMVVFAGASQFIAVNLLLVGAGLGEIILTVFMVNIRHVLFATSLSPKMTKEMKPWLPVIAFGLTDEIFSILSLKEKELSKGYIILLEFCAYSALAVGTLLGFILGSILPVIVQMSMGIALYALFAAILMPELKKSKKVAILIVVSGALNSLLTFVFHMAQGWSMIVTIIVVASLGLLLGKEGDRV